MTWANNYQDIPFLDVGRDRRGADCYGIPLLVLMERLNIHIPVCDNYATTSAHELIRDVVQDSVDSGVWVPIEKGKEKEYDIILLRYMGLPIHIGILTDIKNHMIHTTEGAGVTHENYKQGKWTAPGKVVGFYRHRDLCKN